MQFDTGIEDALKLALISMDSPMRSNIGVGPPVDVAMCRRDTLELQTDIRIDHSEPYFHNLRDRCSSALKAAHTAIPKPPYGKGG